MVFIGSNKASLKIWGPYNVKYLARIRVRSIHEGDTHTYSKQQQQQQQQRKKKNNQKIKQKKNTVVVEMVNHLDDIIFHSVVQRKGPLRM